MNLKFMVNDYVLIWNLLFQASISENIHKYKNNLWKNYKKEYNITYKEYKKILKDPKNFIPRDDTIYNLMKEYSGYKELKKETEKYRLYLVKMWDKYKKQTIKELKDIMRIDFEQYQVLVISPKLKSSTIEKFPASKSNIMVWGIKHRFELENLIHIVFDIVKKELENFKKEYQDIVKAVVELVVLNEFATRISGKSKYLSGDESLKYLKTQIYPYWLMYLGVKKEDLVKYMQRDKIVFDVSKYTYERQLRKVDLFTFIDFCIKNQKHILKINELEII